MTCIFFHIRRYNCTLYRLDTSTWSSHHLLLFYCHRRRRCHYSLFSAFPIGPFAIVISRWCSPSGPKSFSSGITAWTVPSVLRTHFACLFRWPGSGARSRRCVGNATCRYRRSRWCLLRIGRPGWPSRWSPRRRGLRPRASEPLLYIAKPSPSDLNYRSQCTFLLNHWNVCNHDGSNPGKRTNMFKLLSIKKSIYNVNITTIL